tara:strand:+ start:61 stop:303 length:243 start_codon:yes stop_codon:yes gene_type:complete
MARFKLMTDKKYFDYVYNSTFIGNLNTGKVVPDGYFSAQQKVEPMANSQKIVYNSSNFIANNTKPQSNYMNPRGITNDKS